MEEVVYSLNGIEFNTKNNPYKIFVSKSDGLMAKLKPKAKTTYEWPNQHGKQSNPLQKVRYESREISLECWVEGSGWKEMKDNYDSLMSEFDKLGTQRLIISPFGTTTPLIYDVVLVESSDPKQAFNNGEMIGIFTIKMIEERPVKKILYTESTNLQLSFGAPSMVIINIDGKAQQAKGNVVINKTLPARVILGNYLGRNLILQSKKTPVEMGGGASLQLEAGGFQLTNATEFCRWNTSNVQQGLLTLSFKIKRIEGQGDGRNIRFYNGTGYEEIPNTSNITTETIVTHSFRNSGNIQGLYMTFLTGRIEISWLQLESGNKSTDWTPAPEDQHYISIAGNIDEITNLNTNAQILWEKL
ncbi:hypothetical protein [Elizabethkingia anophelis]|uniref:hypothetical protein n=1 Tax=Elizabethkingia anophelis TaxID=1117645 RepID=UPI0016890F64|nr:hypothetical protein [Elizabethkingia anophelis]QNV11237.1 hypothetical protein EIY88_18700 [Elizabethkingia anophelis]UTF89388.1 hypothetical protein J2N93_18815 [Elizabethkingia anophelis]UTG53862.1 hypothetical protein J2O05_18800 [Elizabethkingia anophelis]